LQEGSGKKQQGSSEAIAMTSPVIMEMVSTWHVISVTFVTFQILLPLFNRDKPCSGMLLYNCIVTAHSSMLPTMQLGHQDELCQSPSKTSLLLLPLLLLLLLLLLQAGTESLPNDAAGDVKMSFVMPSK
jgi:hypothetical protein